MTEEGTGLQIHPLDTSHLFFGGGGLPTPQPTHAILPPRMLATSVCRAQAFTMILVAFELAVVHDCSLRVGQGSTKPPECRRASHVMSAIGSAVEGGVELPLGQVSGVLVPLAVLELQIRARELLAQASAQALVCLKAPA